MFVYGEGHMVDHSLKMVLMWEFKEGLNKDFHINVCMDS